MIRKKTRLRFVLASLFQEEFAQACLPPGGRKIYLVTPGTPEFDAYLRNRAALIDHAALVLGCRARAEDVVQEAFVRYSQRQKRSLEAAGGLQPISDPVSYLHRVVRNLALDWLRKPEAAMKTGDSRDLERLPDATATPEQAMMEKDQVRVLQEALAELPERTRIAFTMRRLEGRSLQEIADHLGVSVVRAHQLVKDAVRHGAARLDKFT